MANGTRENSLAIGKKQLQRIASDTVNHHLQLTLLILTHIRQQQQHTHTQLIPCTAMHDIFMLTPAKRYGTEYTNTNYAPTNITYRSICLNTSLSLFFPLSLYHILVVSLTLWLSFHLYFIYILPSTPSTATSILSIAWSDILFIYRPELYNNNLHSMAVAIPLNRSDGAK